MPESAARPSGRHRFLLVFSVLAVVLLGFFALGRLPVNLLSSHESPRLRVEVSVPGVAASVVEENVTRPLEAALADVPGVAAIESVTTFGQAAVDLRLGHPGVVEAVQQDVGARLERAKSSWPDAVEPPTISLVDPSAVAAEWAISSPAHDLLRLRDWAEGEFAKKLMELPGIAAVEAEGGAVREIVVMPDQRRLAGLGLSFDDVMQAIRKGREADFRERAPPAKKRSRRVALPSGDVAAVAAIPVMLPTGESIALSEVARIALGEQTRPDRFRFNGVDAVKVTVQKRTSAALSDVAERARAHIEWMRANRVIPDDIEIHPVSRPLEEARHSLRRIAAAFSGGVLLVLLSAYLLSGSGRRTLLIGVTMAATVQAVFALMALSGLALDVMTLGGLALGAILLSAGVAGLSANGSSLEAVGKKSAAVAVAVLPLALSPFLFSGGALFHKFIFVFASAWVVSAVLAAMLLRAFDRRASRGVTPREAIRRRAADFVLRFYQRGLRRLLPRPAIALTISGVLAGALMAAALMKEQEFSLAPSGAHVTETVLHVQGPDMARLAAIGDDLVRRLRAAPGLREAKHSAQKQDELVLRMNEERARELGVDGIQAGRAFAAALAGIPAGGFRDAEHRYDMRLRLPPEESGRLMAQGRILLLGELEGRPAVHLNDVATIERVAAAAQLRRYNGVAAIQVTLSPAKAESPERLMAQARRALEGYALPEGYRLAYGGAMPAAGESGIQGFALLGFALMVVFVAQTLWLRSVRVATLIFLTALYALAGVGAAVLLFDLPVSMSVWLGAALLVGLDAGQATMLVAHSTIVIAREKHPAAHDVILQAAKHRFYPMFAVTLMAMLGITPLMLAGSATAVLHPLMIIVVAGLLFSFVANLLIAPLFYLFLEVDADKYADNNAD